MVFVQEAIVLLRLKCRKRNDDRVARPQEVLELLAGIDTADPGQGKLPVICNTGDHLVSKQFLGFRIPHILVGNLGGQAYKLPRNSGFPNLDVAKDGLLIHQIVVQAGKRATVKAELSGSRDPAFATTDKNVSAC